MDAPDKEPFKAFVKAPEREETLHIPGSSDEIIVQHHKTFDFLVQQLIDDESEEGDNSASDNIDKNDGIESSDQDFQGSDTDSSEDSEKLVSDRAENDTVKATPEEEIEMMLEPFKEMNGRDKRVPWNERYEVIQEQFPSINNLDWNKVFRADPTIMGNILNDIIKVEVAPKGRPGKRPALSRDEAEEFWGKYQKQDYTLKPFAKALNELKGTTSIRQMARKVSMSPSYAYNLMTGYKQPKVEDMILVAQAYGKHPSYFYEYRVAYVTAVMSERIDYAPESSIIYYERIKDSHERS